MFHRETEAKLLHIFFPHSKVYLVFNLKFDEYVALKDDTNSAVCFQGHVICQIPAYHDQSITKPAEVDIVIHSSGRISQPAPFTYLPGNYFYFTVSSSLISKHETRPPGAASFILWDKEKRFRSIYNKC